MILYHGSTLAIKNPDVFHSRERVDFGKGFCTTPLLAQAKRWAARFVRLKQSGVVSNFLWKTGRGHDAEKAEKDRDFMRELLEKYRNGELSKT